MDQTYRVPLPRPVVVKVGGALLDDVGARTSFLDRVRKALGHPPAPPPPAFDVELVRLADESDDLPSLFEAYPDAKLALMLRDPVKSAASVVDVSGVLYYMRSDDTTLGKGFGRSIDGKETYQTLQDMIDWMEDGRIPKDRVFPIDYPAFFADPDAALEKLYGELRLPLPDTSKQAMLDYVAHKPKDKFGKHDYEMGDPETIAATRAAFRPFQDYFGVASEV